MGAGLSREEAGTGIAANGDPNPARSTLARAAQKYRHKLAAKPHLSTSSSALKLGFTGR
ncbi:hypothetical protein D3C76_1699430 [compost metagenome]